MDVDAIQNSFNEALTRYFTRLSQVGYFPENGTFSIIVLSYIIDMMNSTILTSEEKEIVERAFSCLQGSCIIPYEYCKGNCI